MDLRGKPSTFSADGTRKPVVGEDGLDGGSLVVSMLGGWMDERLDDGRAGGREESALPDASPRVSAQAGCTGRTQGVSGGDHGGAGGYRD